MLLWWWWREVQAPTAQHIANTNRALVCHVATLIDPAVDQWYISPDVPPAIVLKRTSYNVSAVSGLLSFQAPGQHPFGQRRRRRPQTLVTRRATLQHRKGQAERDMMCLHKTELPCVIGSPHQAAWLASKTTRIDESQVD